MGVEGIIVARTDAEAANLLDGSGDERDQPFILGVTNTSVPSYKAGFLAVLRRLYSAGIEEVNGHLIYAVSDEEYADADAWLEANGVTAAVDAVAARYAAGEITSPEELVDAAGDAFLTKWEEEAGLTTLGQAVSDVIAFRSDEDTAPDITVEEYGPIKIHNSYIRYLLPMMVEVQYYEGVEVQIQEICRLLVRLLRAQSGCGETRNFLVYPL